MTFLWTLATFAIYSTLCVTCPDTAAAMTLPVSLAVIAATLHHQRTKEPRQ